MLNAKDQNHKTSFSFLNFLLGPISSSVCTQQAFFRISATYEMRTTEYGEILYFNDNQRIGEKGFYIKRKEEGREQTAGKTERESERVCVSVGRRRR